MSIGMNVGATIGRPRAADSRPYKFYLTVRKIGIFRIDYITLTSYFQYSGMKAYGGRQPAPYDTLRGKQSIWLSTRYNYPGRCPNPQRYETGRSK